MAALLEADGMSANGSEVARGLRELAADEDPLAARASSGYCAITKYMATEVHHEAMPGVDGAWLTAAIYDKYVKDAGC